MVLPADSYIVVNKSIITEVDKKILVDLYQPIIGNSAVSLYLTLLNDLEKNSFVTGELTHHHLLSVMQISLEDIVKSREKLEGIGLVKTYVKKGSVNNYVYVLYAPVSASEFLNHPILNMVLYNNVGKLEYKKIVDSYKLPRIVLKDYEDISLKFDDVFTSVTVNSFFNNDNIVSKKKGEILFKDIVDFELLISGLDSNMINEKAFNKDVRNLINNLSFLGCFVTLITSPTLISTPIIGSLIGPRANLSFRPITVSKKNLTFAIFSWVFSLSSLGALLKNFLFHSDPPKYLIIFSPFSFNDVTSGEFTNSSPSK